jgi:hypothetical protein
MRHFSMKEEQADLFLPLSVPAVRSVDEVIRELSHFTVEQRSLAWSPEPPVEACGASDCRVGGDCGLDFDRNSRHSQWGLARYRWKREQKRSYHP